jgi:hypothetical protein
MEEAEMKLAFARRRMTSGEAGQSQDASRRVGVLDQLELSFGAHLAVARELDESDLG